MPASIITFYVILIARIAVSAFQIVYHLPSNSSQETIVAGSSIVEFALCMIMLIALFERKRWSVKMFRVYLGMLLPLSLVGLLYSALENQSDGGKTPWTKFVGGIIGGIGLGLLAWRLGSANACRYFDAYAYRRFSPAIKSAEMPNQSMDPTLASGTPAAKQPAHLP